MKPNYKAFHFSGEKHTFLFRRIPPFSRCRTIIPSFFAGATQSIYHRFSFVQRSPYPPLPRRYKINILIFHRCSTIHFRSFSTVTILSIYNHLSQVQYNRCTLMFLKCTQSMCPYFSEVQHSPHTLFVQIQPINIPLVVPGATQSMYHPFSQVQHNPCSILFQGARQSMYPTFPRWNTIHVPSFFPDATQSMYPPFPRCNTIHVPSFFPGATQSMYPHFSQVQHNPCTLIFSRCNTIHVPSFFQGATQSSHPTEKQFF